MIKAKILKHSKNIQGDEVVTYELLFPRIILSEINTHREASRNTSSSRAVPFHKMVEMVQNNPFIPIAWQKHHKGMQGNEYETNESELILNEQEWLGARDNAIEVAKILYEEGKVTKQLCNRLLEPFMWTRMIFTISKKGIENLFNLRCPRYKFDNGYGEPTFFFSKKEWEEVNKWKGSQDGSEGLDKKITTPKNDFEWKALNEGQAEIHFMELAEQMYDAYKESRPQILGNNEWHIPFEEEIINQFPLSSLGERIKISAVMCARTSYTVIEEGKPLSLERYLELYDLLISSDPPHSSTLEHTCKTMTDDVYKTFVRGSVMKNEHDDTFITKKENSGWCYNLKGFMSLRYIIENVKE